MPNVYFDIETRSEADIKGVGGYNYLEHPSTSLLCFAWSVDGGVTRIVTPESHPDWMDQLFLHMALDKNSIFICHNVQFEYQAWNTHFIPLGYPPIPLNRWKCTMAKAYTAGLPGGLEEAAIGLGLPIQKDMEGYKAMLKLSKPRRKAGTPWWTPEHAPDDFKKLYRYCGIDTEVSRLIDERLPDLTPKERVVWEMDFRMNSQGIQLDIDAVKKATHLVYQHQAQLLQRFAIVTSGKVTSPKQYAQFKDWLNRDEWVTEDVQAETLNKLAGSGSLPLESTYAIHLAQEINKSSLAKYPKMVESANTFGLTRGWSQYCGAHTKRWAGRAWQPQNLPRPGEDVYFVVDSIKKYNYEGFKTIHPVVADSLSSGLRGMVISPPGFELYVADYGQIEDKTLAWLAGEQHVLDAYKSGADLYSETASRTYGYEVNKSMDERQTGKVQRLAFGYQGGIGAGANMAKAYRLDLMKVYSILWGSTTAQEREEAERSYQYYLKKNEGYEVLSREEAMIVDIMKIRYRLAHPNVVDFWRRLEECAIEAIENKYPVRCGKLKFHMWKDFLRLECGSGEYISYPHPRVSSGSFGRKKIAYESVRGYTTTYGGELAENATQFVSREIMVDGMIRADHKYKAYMHVHDEPIAIAPIGDTSCSIEEYISILKTNPVWAPDIPLSVDGWKGYRYKK